MRKRQQKKKAANAGKRSKSGRSYTVQDQGVAYEIQENPLLVSEAWHGSPPIIFKVTHGGKHKVYPIRGGFGYFIPSLRKATSLVKVNELVERGIRSREVEPIVAYLGLTVPDIAKAAAVSPSTVSRWDDESSIGVAGSDQFFRIDEVIKKGVELFGSLEYLKGWLQSPNIALGSTAPVKLITSRVGIEMVDEALDALHYGNVM